MTLTPPNDEIVYQCENSKVEGIQKVSSNTKKSMAQIQRNLSVQEGVRFTNVKTLPFCVLTTNFPNKTSEKRKAVVGDSQPKEIITNPQIMFVSQFCRLHSVILKLIKHSLF